MASGMGQAAMGSYYTPAAAYGSLSAASMAAAAAAAAQQSAAMSGLAAPAQVCSSYDYHKRHINVTSKQNKYWLTHLIRGVLHDRVSAIYFPLLNLIFLFHFAILSFYKRYYPFKRYKSYILPYYYNYFLMCKNRYYKIIYAKICILMFPS